MANCDVIGVLLGMTWDCGSSQQTWQQNKGNYSGVLPIYIVLYCPPLYLYISSQICQISVVLESWNWNEVPNSWVIWVSIRKKQITKPLSDRAVYFV